MNYSTAVFLINDSVRAIAVDYEPTGKRTIFKTLDADIKVDDFVVVPTGTRHGMTVVRVVEVDSDVDYDAPQPVEWVVQRVDRSEYDQTVAQEAEAIKAVKSAEVRKKREDLAAAMLKDHGGIIGSLAIASHAKE